MSLKRTRAAEEGGEPGHRFRNAAFQTHATALHERPCAAAKYTCIRGDKPVGPLASRGRSIGYELIDNARVFSELSHDVVRLIDEVGHTTSKLVPPDTLDCQETHHFSLLASQALKNAQRGSATCKQIDTIIADSVDRIRQGIIVMEQAGLQMLQVIDSVIQASEVTSFMGGVRSSASQPTPDFVDEADDGGLLLLESVVAVQDLKCWALVLKRNLQTLRLSGYYEEAYATQQVGNARG
ncbi:hypothetical protein [Dyella flagellata]|uniref:hypothetical protein n=1 Tax=Dyella flagellata TaxID=1867833 RepID=UPI0024E113F2|nr:hypothetical protein [Dyella flagellata]